MGASIITEEYYIRKLADLLHLSPADFIRVQTDCDWRLSARRLSVRAADSSWC